VRIVIPSKNVQRILHPGSLSYARHVPQDDGKHSPPPTSGSSFVYILAHIPNLKPYSISWQVHRDACAYRRSSYIRQLHGRLVTRTFLDGWWVSSQSRSPYPMCNPCWCAFSSFLSILSGIKELSWQDITITVNQFKIFRTIRYFFISISSWFSTNLMKRKYTINCSLFSQLWLHNAIKQSKRPYTNTHLYEKKSKQ